jgi:hypothetical protein
MLLGLKTDSACNTECFGCHGGERGAPDVGPRWPPRGRQPVFVGGGRTVGYLLSTPVFDQSW